MSKVFGTVEPGFEKAKKVFEENFVRRGEIGAACTAYYKGKKVIDLWGGYKNKHQLWEEDTMVLLFSATKGIASMIIAKLHSEGLLNYQDKVSKFWPEFSQNGKADITIKQLLSHQAGLVLLDTPLEIYQLNDFDYVAQILAKAKPMWEPGNLQGYQATTIGFYLGELVRRVDSKHRSLGTYFDEEIAKPFALDFYIGLPNDISEEKIAKIKMINPLLAVLNIRKMPKGIRKVMLDFKSPFVRSMTLVKGYNPNKRETWQVEQPSGNGIGTARSLAYLYSILSNGGKDINISDTTFELLNSLPEKPSKGYHDQVMNIETRYGLGFMKPDPTFTFSSNPNAFGFLGATGSFAFADPQKKLGYAYVTRKMGYYGVNDPREKSVREAIYECIDDFENKAK